MSLQEAAIAIGLLTPLILGILAFAEKFIHHKKEPEESKVPQGMAVNMDNPYADQLIEELRKDNEASDKRIADLQAQLSIYKELKGGNNERT